VWLNIGIEKVDNDKGVSVKALLDSGATGMFADRKFVEKKRLQIRKVEETNKNQKCG